MAKKFKHDVGNKLAGSKIAAVQYEENESGEPINVAYVLENGDVVNESSNRIGFVDEKAHKIVSLKANSADETVS